jgi:hypothetical protein
MMTAVEFGAWLELTPSPERPWRKLLKKRRLPLIYT